MSSSFPYPERSGRWATRQKDKPKNSIWVVPYTREEKQGLSIKINFKNAFL